MQDVDSGEQCINMWLSLVSCAGTEWDPICVYIPLQEWAIEGAGTVCDWIGWELWYYFIDHWWSTVGDQSRKSDLFIEGKQVGCVASQWQWHNRTGDSTLGWTIHLQGQRTPGVSTAGQTVANQEGYIGTQLPIEHIQRKHNGPAELDYK